MQTLIIKAFPLDLVYFFNILKSNKKADTPSFPLTTLKEG
jgi:hypothetical protein